MATEAANIKQWCGEVGQVYSHVTGHQSHELFFEATKLKAMCACLCVFSSDSNGIFVNTKDNLFIK